MGLTLYTAPVLISLAVGLLFTGAVAGVLAGLLGVGGGIVIVPVLFWLLEYLDFPASVAMHMAVGTSLATIIPTSISSARLHHSRGAIDTDLLKRWAPFVAAGAALGGWSAMYMSSQALTAVFAVIAFLVAVNMLLPKQIVLAKQLPESRMANTGIGAVIGFFSSLMGIGGGTLSVPTLAMFSFPVHRAVGTASAFGFVIALPAVLGFINAGWGAEDRPPWSLGYVSIPAAVLLFSASVFTAPVGGKIAHRLDAKKLRWAFALFLMLSAAKMASTVWP